MDKQNIKDWWMTRVRDELGRPRDLTDGVLSDLFEENLSVNEACRFIQKMYDTNICRHRGDL